MAEKITNSGKIPENKAGYDTNGYLQDDTLNVKKENLSYEKSHDGLRHPSGGH